MVVIFLHGLQTNEGKENWCELCYSKRSGVGRELVMDEAGLLAGCIATCTGTGGCSRGMRGLCLPCPEWVAPPSPKGCSGGCVAALAGGTTWAGLLIAADIHQRCRRSWMCSARLAAATGCWRDVVCFHHN